VRDLYMFAGRRVRNEAQHPTMDIVQVGITALAKARSRFRVAATGRYPAADAADREYALGRELPALILSPR